MKRIGVLILALLLILTACQSSQPEPAETVPATAAPTTQPVQAQRFIEFSREGVPDRIPVELTRGTSGNYTICYDPERFTQEGDLFRDHVWGDRHPMVYYAVSYFPDMTAQELTTGLILQNEGDFASYETETTTISQYDATGIYFSGKDIQLHFFAVDSPFGGAYLLETQFVLEMYEGLYPQIRAALDTFEILE